MPIEDDVLPLTKPIVGTSGRVYTELQIPKGTAVTISTFGYNLYIFFTKPRQSAHPVVRNHGLWGSDAHVFRPQRWFEMSDEVESPVGVYGNLYGRTWYPGGAVGH